MGSAQKSSCAVAGKLINFAALGAYCFLESNVGREQVYSEGSVEIISRAVPGCRPVLQMVFPVTRGAALTIYRILFNEDVTTLPSRMVPQTPDLPTIDLGPSAEAVFLAVELAAAEGVNAPPGSS